MPQITRNADGSPAQYVIGRSLSADGGSPYEMLRREDRNGMRNLWTVEVERATRFSARGADLMLAELKRQNYAGLMALPLREGF